MTDKPKKPDDAESPPTAKKEEPERPLRSEHEGVNLEWEKSDFPHRDELP